MHDLSPIALLLVFSWYAALSVATFVAFALDKRAAILSRRRIPEVTLHWFEALGGWPGAFLAQHLLRHKSTKISYRVILWCIALAHLAGWALYLLRGML